MAVAVKKDAEARTGLAALGLAGASLLGTLYVILGLLGVYYLFPWLWNTYLAPAFGLEVEGFLSAGLRLLLMGMAAVGPIALGPRLLRPAAQPGVRAGVFLGVVLVGVGLAVIYLANYLASLLGLGTWLEGDGLLTTIVVSAVTAGLWTVLLWRWFHKETFQARLRVIEEQGWFTLKPYKKGQGTLVRRGTMLGLLILVGAGLWVYTGGQLRAGNAWAWTLPLAPDWEVLILRSPGMAVPVLVALLTLWFAYRLVNYPRFADFLIATEGELNKVSWSSRQRLIQDTLVVLTTVVLLTLFLYAMDFLWSTVLRWIGVLRVGS